MQLAITERLAGVDVAAMGNHLHVAIRYFPLCWLAIFGHPVGKILAAEQHNGIGWRDAPAHPACSPFQPQSRGAQDGPDRLASNANPPARWRAGKQKGLKLAERKTVLIVDTSLPKIHNISPPEKRKSSRPHVVGHNAPLK